jgi:hypothetical protein
MGLIRIAGAPGRETSAPKSCIDQVHRGTSAVHVLQPRLSQCEFLLKR